MKLNLRIWAIIGMLCVFIALCATILSATGAQPAFWSNLTGRIYPVLSPNVAVGDDSHAGKLALSDGASKQSVITVSGGRIAVTDASGNIAILASNSRNYLDNGGFSVQQRCATASTAIAGVSTTTRGGQVADRWAVTSSVASNLNWAQIDTAATPETGLLSRYYGSIIASSAGKKVLLSQWVLSSDMAALRGQKVRLSCKTNQKVGTGQVFHLGLLYLSTSGTVDSSPAFLSGAFSATAGTAPSWGTNISVIDPETTPAGENGTVAAHYLGITTVATTWQRSSAVFTVPSDALNLVTVLWQDTTGGATDNISVAEFQLTQGTDLVDYTASPLAYEMARCQRFFDKSFPYAIVPAASVSIANGGYGSCGSLLLSGSGTALGSQIPVLFHTRMWKVPTVTLYTPVGAGAVVYRHTGTTPAVQGTTAVATNSTTDIGCLVTATNEATTNGTVGDLVSVHWKAEADFIQ